MSVNLQTSVTTVKHTLNQRFDIIIMDLKLHAIRILNCPMLHSVITVLLLTVRHFTMLNHHKYGKHNRDAALWKSSIRTGRISLAAMKLEIRRSHRALYDHWCIIYGEPKACRVLSYGEMLFFGHSADIWSVCAHEIICYQWSWAVWCHFKQLELINPWPTNSVIDK